MGDAMMRLNTGEELVEAQGRAEAGIVRPDGEEMALADDVLNALSAVYAGGPACDGAGAERRRAERCAFHAPLVVEPVVDDVMQQAVTVLLQDYSAVGIGFLHSTTMAQHTALLMRLPCERGGSMTVVCRVVRCRAGETGVFRIGAEFVRVLDGGREPHGVEMAEGGSIRIEWPAQGIFPGQFAAVATLPMAA